MWMIVTIAIIGMIILVFLSTPISSDGVSGPATASVWGYGAIAISVLSLIFTMIGDKNKSSAKKSEFMGQVMHTIPAFLMLIVLIFIITATSHYYVRINKGFVSRDYYKYSTLATLTIITQYGLLVYYIISESLDYESSDNSIVATYLNYLFAIGNSIIIGMLVIIAKYFTTDG
jgi:hypothetical protein